MSTGERRTPILAAALGLMRALQWLTLKCYLRFFFPDLRERSDILATEHIDASSAYRYAFAFDAYVLLWIALEATSLLITTFWPTELSLAVVQGLAISRIVDLVRVGLNTSLFDQVTARGDTRVASAPRLVVLALLSYVELMACFAVIYASHLQLLIQVNGSASSVADAILFAALTQMTVSFGRQFPDEWLGFVAALQVFLGLLLVVLIISRVTSSLRPLKSLDEDVSRPASSPPTA